MAGIGVLVDDGVSTGYAYKIKVPLGAITGSVIDLSQGISEGDMIYSKRIDFVSDNELYKGEAAVGSTAASSVWRIRKIVIGLDGDVTETWASGNSNFDKIWNSRLSLVYS